MAITTRSMKQNLPALILAAMLAGGWAASASAEVVVIGNKADSVSQLTPEQAEEIYLAKTTTLPDGSPVEVVDLPADNSVRNEFYQNVTGKDASQVKAYWAKRVFTGQGTPPETKPTEAAVVQWVAAGKGRIGYVSPAAADGSVKILLKKKE
ncbi:MAG: hypothetical protein HY940_00475 [Gammaproteobacteria bacterium]|nr:hypothetical protein [Gammaproteobacteria bacterium]